MEHSGDEAAHNENSLAKSAENFGVCLINNPL